MIKTNKQKPHTQKSTNQKNPHTKELLHTESALNGFSQGLVEGSSTANTFSC